MRISVRYFAVLRELRGTSTETVDLPAGSTARTAYLQLFPSLGLPVAFAVNERSVPGDTALAEGDELALLPPLGGG
jgi:molybdopterin synthase catalytic subunit